jgi:hypothetical protein
MCPSRSAASNSPDEPEAFGFSLVLDLAVLDLCRMVEDTGFLQSLLHINPVETDILQELPPHVGDFRSTSSRSASQSGVAVTA